jgi:hypothetical protein
VDPPSRERYGVACRRFQNRTKRKIWSRPFPAGGSQIGPEDYRRHMKRV